MSYRLVHNENGSTSVACTENDEIMHPGVGPEIEAQTLYVDELNLPARLQEQGRLIIWDVGMGAAANVLASIAALGPVTGKVEILSFDRTSQALRFARNNAEHFPQIANFRDTVDELLETGRTAIGNIRWTFFETDFPTWLTIEPPCPAPHAILFDAWSPRSNPAMWTFTVFQQLRERVAGQATLATYSRATCIRSALLLAGFLVGRGPAIGSKEETTIAATSRDLLNNPLPREWLLKAERSHSGRPFVGDTFEQAPLAADQLKQLRAHPQFR